MAVLHMLAIPVPLQGHINPLLHMLDRLCSPEIITTLLVPHRDLHRMQRSIANPFVRAVAIPPHVLELDDIASLPSTSQLFVLLDALEASKDALAAFISAGFHSSGMWSAPLACLLIELFVQMGQGLADKLRLPRIAMWTSSAAGLLVNSHIPDLVSHGVLPSSEGNDRDREIEDLVPGLPKLCVRDLPSSLLTASPESLEKRIHIMSRNKEAACIFINSIEELEPGALASLQELLHPTKFLAIGPLLPSTFLSDHPETAVSAAEGLWKEDTECLRWLDEREPRSVLYISFGSMATLSAQQMEELARGVEASKKPFLWVMRPNLISKLAADHAKSFVDNFVARTKSQGLVISWAPQLQVLKHPALGGFLTHCGWNSTLEAVCCGVPMLGWPCFAEQNINCKIIVEDWKIGMSCHPGAADDIVGKDEIERVVRQFMDDPGKEMRRRALELRDNVRSTVREGGSSNRNLSTFVDLISKGVKN